MRTGDYEKAAEFFNACRQKGIPGSNIDFLICAAAANRGYAIFTTDNDFRIFQRVIQFTLF
jgi:predicted nucleic acid-binding protein